MQLFTFLPVIVLINSVFTRKIIDLTWNFNEETIYWGDSTPFNFTNVIQSEKELGYWYVIKEFCAGEHGGTHFDAPYHFYKEGWKVAEVPVDRLMGNGALVDLTGSNTRTLTPQNLKSWIQDYGDFENNTILLIKFGWSKFWSNKTEYMAEDGEGKLHFPGISPEAAKWIADNGRIVGLGLDTPSVDPGESTEFVTHRILSKNQIYNMENVKLLTDDLPGRGFSVVALPMKLEEGTGAPLRVLAILD